MKIVRKTSFAAIPWKNGGGVTHEAIRVPPGGPVFRWRVSVARIETSGPFSDFADYRRTLVLLDGGGVRLKFGVAAPRELRHAGDKVEFDGAAATQCELLAGACTDLNLMVAKSLGAVRSWAERLLQTRLVGEQGASTTLVFSIDGSVSLRADATTTESDCLDPGDLAVLTAGESAFIGGLSGQTPLVFVATFDAGDA